MGDSEDHGGFTEIMATNNKVDLVSVAVHNALYNIDIEWFDLGAFSVTRKEGLEEGTMAFTIAFLQNLIARFDGYIKTSGVPKPEKGIVALKAILEQLKNPRRGKGVNELLIAVMPVFTIPRSQYGRSY